MSGPERDYQIDFTNVRYAPVINVVVRRPDNKILILKRSDSVGFYPGFWNGVGGFIDDKEDLEEKVKTELMEELGLARDDIKSVTMGDIFHVDEPKYQKTWIVHPFRADIKKEDIQLNWEAKDYKWVTPEEALDFNIIPPFRTVLEKLGFIS